MNKKWLLLMVMWLAIQGRPTPAQETNGAEELRWLRQKIEELEQKVRVLEEAKRTNAPVTNGIAPDLNQRISILERNREIDEETVQAKAKETPKISLGGEGLSLASADGNFAVQLRGLI